MTNAETMAKNIREYMKTSNTPDEQIERTILSALNELIHQTRLEVNSQWNGKLKQVMEKMESDDG